MSKDKGHVEDRSEDQTDDQKEEIQRAELIEEESTSEADEARRQVKVKERIIELAAATKDSALSCAVLDLKMTKPYVQPLNLLLYGAAAASLSFFTGNVFFGFLAGFLLAMTYLSYPFAIREKYETDKLFADAGLSPRNLVAGRYIFTLGFSLAAALASILLASVGVLFTRSLESISLVPGMTTGAHGTMLSLVLLYLILALIQLPFYFRLGFVGARFIGLLPVATTAFIAAGLVWLGSGDVIPGLRIVLESVAQSPWVVAAYFASLVIMGLASYLMSLATYRDVKVKKVSGK